MPMLLSVVVPVYNVEEYLPKCLDSIIKQTFKNLEIILINDGSTDNSGKICDDYAKNDRRIKVIHQINRGVSAARNVGLDLCSGDYITFVDSDDWCDENYFYDVMNYFEIYNIDVIITNFERFSVNKSHCNHKSSLKKEIILNSYDAIENMVNRIDFGWEIWATFYKKEVIEDIRFSNNIFYGEDFEFKYTVFRNEWIKVLYLSIIGYHYVIRGNSAVNSYDLNKKINSLVFQEKLIATEQNKCYLILLKKKYFDALIYYFLKFLILGNVDFKIIKKIKSLNEDKSFKNYLKNKTKLKLCILMVISFFYKISCLFIKK